MCQAAIGVTAADAPRKDGSRPHGLQHRPCETTHRSRRVVPKSVLPARCLPGRGATIPSRRRRVHRGGQVACAKKWRTGQHTHRLTRTDGLYRPPKTQTGLPPPLTPRPPHVHLAALPACARRGERRTSSVYQGRGQRETTPGPYQDPGSHYSGALMQTLCRSARTTGKPRTGRFIG